MLTIDDLKPKNFKINVKGVELESKPLKLSHALIISKLGGVFSDAKNSTSEQIVNAERDWEKVVGELIPELKDVQLDLNTSLELITQLMENVEPSDTKELNEMGVSFDESPKGKVTG